MKNAIAIAALAATRAAPVLAHEHGHEGGIATEASDAIPAPFDIVHARITTDSNVAVFHIAVSGRAGESKPAPPG